MQYLEMKNVLHIKHSVLDLNQHVDEADFVGQLTAERDSLKKFEAKCELAESYKTRFLINARAHEKSINRGANAYVPMFTSLGSDTCLVGKTIPLAKVSKWEERVFRQKNPDPARFITLDDAGEEYFGIDGRTLKSDQIASAEKSAKLEELLPIFAARNDLLDHARTAGIDLSDLPYQELVNQLLEVGAELPSSQ